MTDLANLVLAVDSTQVKTGTAALDGLTAAGARAEAAATGLGGGIKGVGVQASAMAVAAQTSARAVMDQAAGFKAATAAAQINTVAMRESLVVARELARGNFTRIPGSLTLLAQGIGSQGGISAFGNAIANQLGLIKTLQNAELTEQAVAAASAAAAVENAAKRAAANVMAADTEVALAEAQVRVTEGTSAEGAAQIRLAEAHQAVSDAAAEAAVAEDALATAMGRANEASAAASASTRTSVTALGASLGILAVAAGLALAGFESFKAEVKDSGDLDKFAEGLRLTDAQIKSAGGSVEYFGHNVKEITGLTITWGDIFHGTMTAIEGAAGAASSQFYGFWREALLETAQVGVSAAQLIISAFAAAAKGAASIVQSLGKDPLGSLTSIATAVVAPGAPQPKGSAVENAGTAALDQFKKTFGDVGKFFHETLPNDILDAAKNRLQKLSDSNNPPKSPEAKKQPRNPADDEIAKLNAQIAGENALADAYLVSDAAAVKAEADQKAMTLAVEKHATAAQTAALKEKELALAIATASANGAQEINNLTFETSARKKVNDMVAAGLIPASQANNYMQLETQLRPLIAAQSLAEGEAKTRLTKEIQDLTKAYADNQAQISRGQALQQEAANDNEIQKLQLETSMLGASNRERAVALAQLEAIQQLANMPGLSAQEQANFVQSEIDKATAGIKTPFQEWAATIPQTAEAINDAFQSIETRGIDNLASAIADVVTGTKSLGQAFRDVATSIISDIIQMTVKMLIFRAISGIFGSAFGSVDTSNLAGGLGSAGSGLNFNTSFGSAKGNVFFGGNAIPFASGGVVGDTTFFPMSGGRTGMMGEAGPEAIMPLTRDSSGRLGVRANDNRSGPVVVELRLKNDILDAKIAQGSAKVVAYAAPGIAKAGATAALRAAGRPKLSGR